MNLDFQKKVVKLLNLSPEAFESAIPESIEKEIRFIYTDFQNKDHNLAKSALATLAFTGVMTAIIFDLKITDSRFYIGIGSWIIILILCTGAMLIKYKSKNTPYPTSTKHPENIYCPFYISSLKTADDFLILLYKVHAKSEKHYITKNSYIYHLTEQILFSSRSIHWRTGFHNLFWRLLILMTTVVFLAYCFGHYKSNFLST